MLFSQVKTLLIGLLVILLVSYGCKRSTEPEPIHVTVSFGQPVGVTILSRTSVKLVSTITAISTSEPVTRGYVLSVTNATPTLADIKTKQTTAITALPYTVSDTVTNLTLNATYYVRPYVTTAAETVYGPVSTFQLKLSVADLFGLELDDLLRGKNVGYGYVVYENNTLKTSGQGGLKSRSVDAEGEKPYTIDTKMHIASMSKTIVAMAFTQVMAQKGIKTTDKIAAYLPPSWPKGDNIDRITFRELLNHRSGIVGLGNNCQNGAFSENIYSGLKQLIGKGVTTANRGQYCYQNANFGLFRVLIPAMTGYSFSGDDATDDQQTQQLYLTYVQKNILEKVGLTGIVPTHPMGDPTYTYDYPYSGRKGWNPGAFTSTLGAYGWYLTPREAGKLYATVLSSVDQTVLSTAYKDSLLINNLGCFRATTNLGDLAYHDGWWYLNSVAPYAGLRTLWIKLPNNLTAVLFVNALNRQQGLFPSDDGSDIVASVTRAYSRARQSAGGRVDPLQITLEHPEPH